MAGEEMVPIAGNTFPVKEQLKALGGRWNPKQKVWMVPASRADEARGLLPPPRFISGYQDPDDGYEDDFGDPWFG